MYCTPDLTGQDPAYLKDNDTYIIHKDRQKIDFDEPVFLDSIVIHMLDNLGTASYTLIRGIDWQTESADIADTAISRMKVYDEYFDKDLVNSIRITKPFVSEYRICMEYQKLYPENIKRSLLNSNMLEVTPDLIGSMLENIEYLSMITRSVADTDSLHEGQPMLFQLDIHKENPHNYVEHEIHEINVLENRNIVKPIGGSFFKDSVKVRIKDDPNYLELGRDYLIFRNNLSKTASTSNVSGVYDFIYINREYVGKIEVSYHAYGGDATVYDVTELNTKCNNILNYLTDSSFLTSASLGTAPAIAALRDKVLELEDDMRKLLSGQASYGDVSDGKAILKKITAADDELHWYTLAELYKVDGSNDIIISDRMQFRLKTLKTNMMFDAIISVNLSNETNKFHVDLLSEHYDKGFIPYEDYSNINNIIRPQLRIVYNTDDIENSGVLLQLGMEFKGFIEETVVVEDLSGKECCWKLVTPPDTAVGPEDDTIPLPNSEQVYDSLNPDSISISTLVPFKDGYIVWAGAYPLNREEGGFKELDLDHFIPNNIDLTKITRARMELRESSGLLFPLDIIFIPGSTDMTGLGNFMYNGEPCYINLRLWKDTNNDVYLRATSDVDRNNIAAQLDLVHIFLFTN
jgi:hypothetical protein